jgi:hypothetical protein
MDEMEPQTSFVELTIEAHEERRKRWDWDYVMCMVIRAWETCLRQKSRQLKSKQPGGSMAWYHWHEICDRAFFRMSERLEELSDAVRVSGDRATLEEAQRLQEAGQGILRVVGEECRRARLTMNERLAKRQMQLFVDLEKEA